MKPASIFLAIVLAPKQNNSDNPMDIVQTIPCGILTITNGYCIV